MLTTKEAAKKISVQPETIRKYIREGVGKNNTKLPATHVMHGRRREYRIKQSDLEEFRLEFLTVKND